VFVEGPQEKHCFCVTCVRSLAIPAHSLRIVLGDAPAAVPIHMLPRLAMAAGYPPAAASLYSGTDSCSFFAKPSRPR
jgi:hypothetical protein